MEKKQQKLGRNLVIGVGLIAVVAALIAIGSQVGADKTDSTDKADPSTQTGAQTLTDAWDTTTTEALTVTTATDGTTQEQPTQRDRADDTTSETALPAAATTGGTSTTGNTTTGNTTTRETTTAAKKTTTKHSSGSGGAPEAAAYAYAGFSPVVTDMNRSWNLILINKDYCLPAGYSPNLSESVPGTGVKLDSRVSPHYLEMYNAAAKDGIYLTPVSGYRSVERQKKNFERKIKYYMDQGYDKTTATQKASTIIFLPGASEHNAGLAMDIISLDTDFDQTKEFRWLNEHAADYGFILRYAKNKISITGCSYEPWHWRYVGVAAAKEMKTTGQCLEEYLGVS